MHNFFSDLDTVSNHCPYPNLQAQFEKVSVLATDMHLKKCAQATTHMGQCVLLSDCRGRAHLVLAAID